MLAKRIIPTMLCRGRTLVKGVAFDSWRSVGMAAQAARIHSMRGVDELVLLDIGATEGGHPPNTDLVRELSESCFTPLAVGGGVSKLEHVQALLDAGADKVVICTAVFTSSLLEKASARYGNQALVASVDVRAGKVWSHAGKQEWPMCPEHFAMLCEDWGAGEILLNDITRLHGAAAGASINQANPGPGPRWGRLVNHRGLLAFDVGVNVGLLLNRGHTAIRRILHT